jgi:redox-sensitive bicupin YhaK (pirin superfamily)
MSIDIYPPGKQGVGAFDDGKFIEQRPIGFPGDSSSIARLGPLFYWAWGKANQDAYIGMHPHQAFEIMTYMINGVVEHQDSLGTKQAVSAGGAQVMQTGSGVYHAEAFRGGDAEGCQIWFEPHLSQTVKNPPTYNQYNHEEFPAKNEHGVLVKTVIGEGSPVQLETDAQVVDLTFEPGTAYTYALNKNRLLSCLVIRGSGKVGSDQPISHKDYVVIKPETDESITLQAADDQPMRVLCIEVPAEVDYPLYRK